MLLLRPGVKCCFVKMKHCNRCEVYSFVRSFKQKMIHVAIVHKAHSTETQICQNVLPMQSSLETYKCTLFDVTPCIFTVIFSTRLGMVPAPFQLGKLARKVPILGNYFKITVLKKDDIKQVTKKLCSENEHQYK